MIKIIYYALPMLIIILGIVIKESKDPAWYSSRKYSTMLIVVGILILITRLIIEFTKDKI